jgi:hypothetical protein
VAAAVDVALESVKLGAIFGFVPFVGNSSLHHSVCDPPHFLH